MNAIHVVDRVVSGGQTGVDRGALDAAIELGIEHGGWCPKGRRAEDGTIPLRYELRENETADYSVRTEQNVIDSDGTLILFRQKLSGGTRLTKQIAEKRDRPCLTLNLSEIDDESEAVDLVLGWLRENSIRVLNCAGPRESGARGIRKQACRVLSLVLANDK